MKHKKFMHRIISMLLSCMMLFGMTSVSVFAMEGDGTYTSSGGSITINVYDEYDESTYPVAVTPSVSVSVSNGKITDISSTYTLQDQSYAKEFSDAFSTLSSQIKASNPNIIGSSVSDAASAVLNTPDVSRDYYYDIEGGVVSNVMGCLKDAIAQANAASTVVPAPESWTAKVSFDVNGDTKTSGTFDNGYSFIVEDDLDSHTFTINGSDHFAAKKDGYTFSGFATSPDASTAEYQPGDKVTVTKENPSVTLYCVWQKERKETPEPVTDSYTILFYANDGKADRAASVQKAKYGEDAVLNANTIIRDGYTFTGWNTKADGSGTAYKDGAKIKDLAGNDEEIILYALWKKNSDIAADEKGKDNTSNNNTNKTNSNESKDNTNTSANNDKVLKDTGNKSGTTNNVSNTTNHSGTSAKDSANQKTTRTLTSVFTNVWFHIGMMTAAAIVIVGLLHKKNSRNL